MSTSGLEIGGERIEPGQRASVRIPLARRYTHADVYLSAHVIHGSLPGPHLFVSAALHGDELNGVEIIRRLLRYPGLRRLRGALIAVPVVNIYGFLNHTRYLPDRRDLNRAFPGSPKGSLTARLAYQFMEEVVDKATHGIDLHTGSIHRENLPHIRACVDDAETERLARAFGTPVILNADLRDGSLRQAVLERKVPMLVYEAGEALRFSEVAIRAGLRGVLSVMRALGMVPESRSPQRKTQPFIARSSSWIRAPDSGILRAKKALGAHVEAQEIVGAIADPLGDDEVPVIAPTAGIIIGRSHLPLANEGDALFHLARFDRPASVKAQLEAFQVDLDDRFRDNPEPRNPAA